MTFVANAECDAISNRRQISKNLIKSSIAIAIVCVCLAKVQCRNYYSQMEIVFNEEKICHVEFGVIRERGVR